MYYYELEGEGKSVRNGTEPTAALLHSWIPRCLPYLYAHGHATLVAGFKDGEVAGGARQERSGDQDRLQEDVPSTQTSGDWDWEWARKMAWIEEQTVRQDRV